MKNNYSTHGPHCNLFSIFQPIYFFDEIIFNLMQDISDKWLNKYDSMMDSHYFRMHEIKFVKLIEVFSINTIKLVKMFKWLLIKATTKAKAKAINMLKLAPKISTKYLWAFDTKTDLCLFRWTEVTGDEFGVFDPSMFELVRFLYQTIETKICPQHETN